MQEIQDTIMVPNSAIPIKHIDKAFNTLGAIVIADQTSKTATTIFTPPPQEEVPITGYTTAMSENKYNETASLNEALHIFLLLIK